MASVGIVLGVLGLPGNILAISRIGKWFTDKIRIYRDAPSVLKELQTFGINLYNGQFYLDIRLAQAFATDYDDPTLVQKLETHLERLRIGLEHAQAIYNKSYDDNRVFDRLRFATSIEAQLREKLWELRSSQAEFYALVSSMDILQRWSDSHHLTHRRFRPSILQTGYCKPVLDTSHAYVGHAEWIDHYDERHYTQILFESHEVGERIRDEVFDSLVYLAVHLPRHLSPQTAILKCLGYRKDPKPELVFEIPSTYSEPCTLQAFLEDASTQAPRGWQKDSWRFAYRLAAAIDRAQAVGLVHKNVRPDSILLFEEDRKDVDSSTSKGNWIPFLTNWTLSRSQEALSYRQGDNDWQKNLYRHPQRQGLHVEERYHAGHDIYSLGVCLLEIGLGEPLVVHDDNGKSNHSQIFQSQAISLQLVSQGNAVDVCRMLKPLDHFNILVVLSHDVLQNRMGRDYARIVQQCLQCMDKPFGPIENWKYQNHEVNPIFQAIVLGPLRQRVQEGDRQDSAP